MLKINQNDKKRYVLGEKRDYEILDKIYGLKKFQLSLEDKRIIKLVKTQLERDWREPLIRFLDELAKKYQK